MEAERAALSEKEGAPSPADRSIAAVNTLLCAPGARYEMETVLIRGTPTRVWKNVPSNLAAVVRQTRAFGARPFIIYEDERVSYEAWFRATARLADHLRALGVKKGDRVALAMRNLPEWLVAFFSVTVLGAIVVPLNAWWTGPELRCGLDDSGACTLICDAERWARIEPLLEQLPTLRDVLVGRAEALGANARRLEEIIGAPGDYHALPKAELPDADIASDDEATIFYTSGTTGNPKGALGTHRNMLTLLLTGGYLAQRSMLCAGLPLQEPPARVTLTVVPMFHVTACCAGLMSTLNTGGTLVFMRKWDPVEAFKLIERERVTATGGVPTIAWQLLEHPDRKKYDLSSLQMVAYGGAPAAPDLARRIKAELGVSPGNGWGMTETSATVTSHAAEDYLTHPESCGRALPVCDIKIMSLDGSRQLPTGEVGELWAKGPQVVKGYWNNSLATAATFVEGWVRTGDLARIDKEGFCYIVDRAKDVIIRGGENIYAVEVENVLYDHPAVTDAALIGLPHRTFGEEPAAVVHLAPGMTATERELQDWVRTRLAGFKVPVRIAFSAETLPRNANGKVLKRELAKAFDSYVDPGGRPATG
jgi:steroid-24-oyl-CoA synthetase